MKTNSTHKRTYCRIAGNVYIMHAHMKTGHATAMAYPVTLNRERLSGGLPDRTEEFPHRFC